MYLIIIHVPIYCDGSRQFVGTDWLRSLCLLRDSFKGRFGEIHVLAPSIPLSQASSDIFLEAVDNRLDGIRFTASIDRRVHALQYWTNHRKRWLWDVRRLVQEAEVVHGGFADPLIPLMSDGLMVAFQRNLPTVAYRDTDSLAQINSLAIGASLPKRLKLMIRAHMFARMARRVARSVDLLMLKGHSLMRWLGPYARNAHSYHDTSYLESEMASRMAVESRIASLESGRRIRLVYCGRLVGRKGVDDSVKLIHAAAQRGANYEFDIIGDGPQRVELQELAQSLGVGSQVKFLGPMTYGTTLIAKLAEYDAMLFTPKMEDTPRMIFDGYAAGLPLIGTGIPYVRERAEDERASILLPSDDPEGAANCLVELWHGRGPLNQLANMAFSAGQYHAADHWYRRRAEWTIEAVERHRSRGKLA